MRVVNYCERLLREVMVRRGYECPLLEEEMLPDLVESVLAHGSGLELSESLFTQTIS